MKLAQVESEKIIRLLDALAKAMEDLLLTGLTTASESTRQTLNVSFQEASRVGLLRLGSNLRATCEELARYTKDQSEFSRKRYTFFLNRAWLLTRGLSRSIKEGNAEEFERLTWSPQNKPLANLEVVTLGVSKKIVPGSFCAFDFRLRSLGTADGGITSGQNLTWSAVFPLKEVQDIPPEAFLHLPQKQKFSAIQLLEGKRVTIENALFNQERSGLCRISLGRESIVTQGEKFGDWKRFGFWEPDAACARLKSYEPGPLDLEVELQEEIFLEDWQIASPLEKQNDSQIIYPLVYRDVPMEVVVTQGREGLSLRTSLEKLSRARRRPGLFALMHYERCKLVLQPLSVLTKDGPEYITLSKDKIDRSSLLKVLKF